MCRSPVIVLFVVLLSAALLPMSARAQTSNPEGEPSTPGPATQTTFYEPYTPTGALNSDIHVLRTVSGSCDGGSNIDFNRADAWVCTVGSTTYDPCFQNNDQSAVACPDFGASTTLSSSSLLNVVVIDVVGSLPEDEANIPFPEPSPFYIQLTDGQYCSPETDGATFGGMPIFGICPNGLWFGLFDQSKPLWTVPILTQGGTASMSEQSNVGVVRVWY
jgi:hypothetical protein